MAAADPARSGSPLRHVVAHLRFNQAGQMLRRAVGLPVWRRDDFVREVEPACAQRLEEIARSVRGAEYKPAIFVHGVLPRSGTNFLANLLALHPDVASFPRRLWEFPLLHVLPGGRALQSEFLAMFPRNAEVLQPYELFALLASGWLADLQRGVGGDRHVLLKSPHVQHLFLFRHLFPRDKLVLCLRDGRDVLASAMATFRGRLLRKSFRQLAVEWRLAADAVLEFAPGGARAHPNVTVVRYEDLIGGGEQAVRDLLEDVELDARGYPYAAAVELPVFGSSGSRERGDARWRPQPRAQDFQPVGRWSTWPERRKRAFMRLAGTTLARAGYCREAEYL